MSRPLLALDVLLGLLACLCAVVLLHEVLTPLTLPPPPALRPAPPASASSPVAVSAPGASSYTVIAAKNLFSPTRSEAPAGPVAVAGPKPFLHGVVMDGPKSRAYLEDPALKRTFGYSVGDQISGGHLETIRPDRVTIAGPDGLIEVLVQDPAKPKPASTQPTASAPTPGTPATRALPTRTNEQ